MFGPDSKPNSRDVLRVTQEAKHTGTEHVNLAAEEWADDSPEESHEYEFDVWHEWHEDDAYAHDAGRMNSPTLKNTKVFPRIWNPLRTKWRKHLPLGKSPAVS